MSRVLDISKAYGEVYHISVFHNSKGYGILGQIFDLIQSFLSKRRDKVSDYSRCFSIIRVSHGALYIVPNLHQQFPYVTQFSTRLSMLIT